MDLRISDAFASNKEAFVKSADRAGFLRKLAAPFGITNITYFGLKIPPGFSDENRLITTYPKNWEKHYFDRRYHEDDPVLVLSMRGILPLDWNNVSRENPKTRKFFGEACDFGISDQGLSVPIRGIYGEQAVFSVNCTQGRKEWRSIKRFLTSDIVYFGNMIHSELLMLETNIEELPTANLTERERQVLNWASKGKTCWETGLILGLAERTVDFYIGNACVKLGVSSKNHAIGIAIRANLI